MNKTAKAAVLFCVVICIAAASVLGAWVLASHEHSQGYGPVEKHACPVCVHIATCRGIVAALSLLLILFAAACSFAAARADALQKPPVLPDVTLFALRTRLNN